MTPVGTATPTQAPAPTAATADPRFSAAFSAGWVVAQLHAPITNGPETSGDEHPLPTARELGRYDRGVLALKELEQLLDGTLAPALAPNAAAIAASRAAVHAAWTQDAHDVAGLRSALEQLHRQLLIGLTVADHRLGSSYSLGRSLSDTCWLPDAKEDFTREFNKYRVGTLQGWLSDLPIGLPKSAAVVAQSLGHWADWLAVNQALDWKQNGGTVKRAAKTQGEHWRALLAGEKPPRSLLTPEGYVAAGAAALKRASAIVRRTATNFWLPIALVVLVTIGAVVLAVHYAEGTARVWASLVSVAAGFGVTGKSIQTTAKGLAADAGRPLLELSEIDAMSWAATELPAISPNRRQRRALRRRGVEPPSA